MSTLILLGGGPESVPVIARAREMGHRAIVVDGNAAAPGLALADFPIVASCYHASDARMALHRAPVSQIDAVLCAATDTPHVAAAIREEFVLPGMTVDQAALSVDKWAQALALSHAGLPTPDFRQVVDDSEIEPPMIVKPLDSRGGRGVIRLLPGVDPEWAYSEARRFSATGRVMVEEWLDGPQLSTESIVQDGRVLFTAVGLRNYDRLEEFAPACIEDGFQSPYEFTQPGPTRADLNGLIEAACAALGWFQTGGGGGTVKGDLAINDGRLFIIELAARLSGGYFATHGHPAAYGVDFVGAAIRLALGERMETPKMGPGAFVAQRYAFPRPDEYGKRIARLPSILTSTGMLFATWARKVGDVVEPVTSHAARLGQVIATGHTPAQARERAQAAAKEMREGVKVEYVQ